MPLDRSENSSNLFFGFQVSQIIETAESIAVGRSPSRQHFPSPSVSPTEFSLQQYRALINQGFNVLRIGGLSVQDLIERGLQVDFDSSVLALGSRHLQNRPHLLEVAVPKNPQEFFIEESATLDYSGQTDFIDRFNKQLLIGRLMRPELVYLADLHWRLLDIYGTSPFSERLGCFAASDSIFGLGSVAKVGVLNLGDRLNIGQVLRGEQRGNLILARVYVPFISMG